MMKRSPIVEVQAVVSFWITSLAVEGGSSILIGSVVWNDLDRVDAFLFWPPDVSPVTAMVKNRFFFIKYQ